MVAWIRFGRGLQVIKHLLGLRGGEVVLPDTAAVSTAYLPATE
jgi:hypothetical protein